jgi:hypothetical protein
LEFEAPADSFTGGNTTVPFARSTSETDNTVAGVGGNDGSDAECGTCGGVCPGTTMNEVVAAEIRMVSETAAVEEIGISAICNS